MLLRLKTIRLLSTQEKIPVTGSPSPLPGSICWVAVSHVVPSRMSLNATTVGKALEADATSRLVCQASDTQPKGGWVAPPLPRSVKVVTPSHILMLENTSDKNILSVPCTISTWICV